MTIVEVAPLPSVCGIAAVEDIHVLFCLGNFHEDLFYPYHTRRVQNLILLYDCVKIGFANGFLHKVL
jgi:hypothetical protein